MSEKELILTSMGYRKMKDEIWAKPVGMHLFMYELETDTFTNWFKSSDIIQIWNSEIYEKDESVEKDFLQFIKYAETYTKTDYPGYSEFEFLTLTQQFELLDF
jgi:hypothetical protein